MFWHLRQLFLNLFIIYEKHILNYSGGGVFKGVFKGVHFQNEKCDCIKYLKLVEAAGESGKTVQRYIWLARLTEPLLEMIDTKRLGISQGADISFLPTEQQLWVQKILQETKITISNAQAVKLKEYSKEGILSPETVQMILAEEKPKKRKYVIREERIRKYFPDHYSNKDMERIIIQLLEEWKNRQ